MLRTNYFVIDEPASRRSRTSSFKLDPALVPLLPLPRPQFEIFVYSPRVEGVHLRGGRVARGGLRWSDRREDFRTEVLGLMKAQMVKNALIVPVGSKGGFVVKRPPAEGGREALLAEGIECYKTFLRGLLDLTDNIVGGEVVAAAAGWSATTRTTPTWSSPPTRGRRPSPTSPTASRREYGFWLGDAFASGGSQGYDHKAMGITARGAWESVKRHFRELGTDIQTTDFTVVGVGDMAGDVFGNGMLLSPHIRLLAAFNHMHIFLDPDPDPAASFAERQRLFELPRSAWSDYDRDADLRGRRRLRAHARSRSRSPPEVRAALGIEAEELAPERADPRDPPRAGRPALERRHRHLREGARARPTPTSATRPTTPCGSTARELRCRVVGEGGNLGFTQRGRIEYALAGGRINTDAIDNVGGVNCSDHEVNIKILLDALVAAGDMTEKQRNELLVEMTDAVARARPLRQLHADAGDEPVALEHAGTMVDVHARLIRDLEQIAGLNRELEFLPDDQEIERAQGAPARG